MLQAQNTWKRRMTGSCMDVVAILSHIQIYTKRCRAANNLSPTLNPVLRGNDLFPALCSNPQLKVAPGLLPLVNSPCSCISSQGGKAGFGRCISLWLHLRRSQPVWSRQEMELLAPTRAQEPPDSGSIALSVATRPEHLQIQVQFSISF